MSWFGEIGRKAVHIVGILIPVGYYLLPVAVGRRILIGLTALVFVIDVIRLNQPRIRTFFFIFFGRMVRDHERYNLLGSTYLLLSSLICAFAFAKPVAVAALCFLILGDSAAALVGKAIGRVRIFGKSLEGSLACLVVCLAVGFGIQFLGRMQGDPGLHLSNAQVLIGSVMATAIELLPVPLDDNLRIPLAAGFAMTLL